MAGITVASAPAASATDPVDGARTSGDAMFPNVGNGGYDALDYDVNIAWTPNATQSGSTIAGSIIASSTMTATAPQPLKSFSLDFEGLEIDSVTVNGVDAAWERDVDPAAIKYKLIVTPATPVSGQFTTKVVYHGAPNSHTDADGSSEGWNRTSDGATMLGQPVGSMTGYPHNNTPADKATYTFTIDIPTTLNNVAGTAPGAAAAVSNGELRSKIPSGDGTRTTWVWREAKPMASELAMVSIGKYDVIEAEFELSDGRKIPSWSFMDSALSATNKTTIAKRAAELGTIIRNLESLYGPYPGNSTGVVVDTVPSGISYALETQDRSFFPATSSVGGNDLIHELVHQWYGNNVAPTTWTDIWIAEGMATWGPTYYNSAEGFATGPQSELTYFNSWKSALADSRWSIPPGAQTDSAELYGYQTYTRSAQFWQALRIAIGDDVFFDLIEQWQVRYAGTSKTAADLKALAEELSGRDLTAFWQDWILDADKPAWPEKLDLTLASTHEPGEAERGDSIVYTLTATNTGLIPLAASVVTVDVGSLLEKATLGTLPDGVTLDGTTLSWAVPATAVGAAPTTVSLKATVTDAASGGEITFDTTRRHPRWHLRGLRVESDGPPVRSRNGGPRHHRHTRGRRGTHRRNRRVARGHHVRLRMADRRRDGRRRDSKHRVCASRHGRVRRHRHSDGQQGGIPRRVGHERSGRPDRRCAARHTDADTNTRRRRRRRHQHRRRRHRRRRRPRSFRRRRPLPFRARCLLPAAPPRSRRRGGRSSCSCSAR